MVAYSSSRRVNVVFDIELEVLIKNVKRLKIMSASDGVQDRDLVPVYTVKSWNEPISAYTNKLKLSKP